MRKLLLILALACGGCSSSPASLSSAELEDIQISNTLRLTLSMPSASLIYGSPVTLDLTLQNMTGHQIKVPVQNPESDFDLYVESDHSRPVPYTRWGNLMQRWHWNKPEKTNASMLLEPHQIARYQIRLDRLYDMTMPGHYSVESQVCVENLLQKSSPDQADSSAYIESNSVQFSIKDARWIDGEVSSATTKPNVIGQKIGGGLRLTASMPTTQATAGDPVFLDLSIENTTDHELGFQDNGSESDFVVDVTDATGIPIPWTAAGSGWENPDTHVPYLHRRVELIGPHETLHYRLSLNQMYDLSMPGEYVVAARRFVPRESAATEVERLSGDEATLSNVIHFKIQKPEPIKPAFTEAEAQ